MRHLNALVASAALAVLPGLTMAGEAPIARLSDAGAESYRDNQNLADDLARSFEASGLFRGYSVDVETEGGIVSLTGTVANEQQRSSMIAMTRRQAGVVSVRDQLAIADSAVVLTAAEGDLGLKAVPNGAVSESTATPIHGHVAEPAPTNAFPGGVMPYSDSPVVPPYAWPSYTPYNNYASMAYQTQYPSGAWPFIGPPYPYPMIPSGWRRTTLTWKRGYWWMKFHSH
ncbi:MAG: BON domain-containing protein [Planctomycetia bacterium]